MEQAVGAHGNYLETSQVPINVSASSELCSPNPIVRVRRFGLAALLLILVIGLSTLWFHGYFDVESIVPFLRSDPIFGPLAFFLIYALSVMCLLPTLPLNLLAGILWGPYWGGIFTLLGASFGAAGAFFATRYVAADYLNAHFNNTKWLWLRKEILENGWKSVAFVRINPIFPFGPLSYFFGLTTIPFFQYLISTMLFIAPWTVLFAAIGNSINGTVLEGDSSILLRDITIISACATFVVLVRVVLKWKARL